MRPIRNLGQLYTFARSGTVIDRETRTETIFRATTTGGSTLLIDGTGTMSQPTTSISTSATEILRIFLRVDDETEFEVEVDDLGLGVRPGHRLTIIYAGDRASQKGYPMAISNQTTNRRGVLPHRVEWLIPRRNAALGCIALAAVPFMSMLVGGVILSILLGPDPMGHVGLANLIGAIVFVFLGLKLLWGRTQNENLKRDIIRTLERKLAESTTDRTDVK